MEEKKQREKSFSVRKNKIQFLKLHITLNKTELS